MNLDVVRSSLNSLRQCELEVCTKIAERDYLIKSLAFHLELASGDLTEPLSPELKAQVYRAIQKFQSPQRPIAAIADTDHETPISLFGGKGVS